MRSRTALPGLMAVLLVTSATAVPIATAGPPVTPKLAPGSATVTLLTGDVVTVSGKQVQVRPAKGREKIVFRSFTDERGDTNVVPQDAQALLQKGTLDPKLFNVTELAESGLDDTSATRLPLIVENSGPALSSAAVRIDRELPGMGATAVSVERSGAYWPTALASGRVWLDERVRVSLEHSVPQIGAPAAWAAGQTGAGTKVAVLDTGVDATHPDLAGAVVDARDFTGGDNADDRNGHGTHVASIITGDHARYRGVAPDTRIINAKVMGDDGSGRVSQIIAGMEWAAEQGADVVNMSISGDPSDGTDPLSQAVNRLTAKTGTLFVVTSGNQTGYVGLPGTADAALTVGAVTRDNALADFSGRGPRAGDEAIKPDITAPGVDIVAARARNATVGEPGQSHLPLSGTSMATPHVAGAAAILAGAHPDWSADQLKAALMSSAVPKDRLTVFEQGAGRVDVAAAVKATVTASPPSLSLGVVRWPHNDNEPITRTLDYTNHGTSPVTLTLRADVVDPGKSPAPAGMFTFTPATLTVPAGGQASTTVTANTAFDGPVGAFEGVVTATPDAGAPVRTPIAVTRETESYDVTVRGIDYDGSPSTNFYYRFIGIERHVIDKKNATSPTTVRLRAGKYTYTGYVQEAKGERLADFAEPTFTVSRDTELVFDARETVPVAVTVDDPDARHARSELFYGRTTDWGEIKMSTVVPGGDFTKVTVKPSTTRDDGFTFSAETLMAKWNGQSFDNSPFLYHLRHSDHSVPATLKWHNRQRELAPVRSEHATSSPGSTGVREGLVAIPLPSTLTEYFTPDVPWNLFNFGEAFNGTQETQFLQLAPMTFPRGKTTPLRWNTGVFGPSMSNGRTGSTSAFRGDNLLYIFVSPLSDQGTGRWGGFRYPGKTQLLRDGQVISEFELATYVTAQVKPERAVYTLRSSFDRSAYAALSTRIDAEWTFASQRSQRPFEQTSLPLLGMTFAPKLDDHNAAPAGKRFTIPVTVQRNESDSPGSVNTPAVEVSYDDGKTWKPTKIRRAGSQWAVTVDHPRDAQFVSLRSSVSDADGNALRQTLIRAYALK
ncbi:S8 family serine peptidase [Lentzea rhizosphaerae]|uniref:S8 family serine peptidase n=1 Tax=Lentzea rhizosphaerae TaxID=2041025 RepID=A0ABV8BMM2_9PSEU